MRFRNGTWLLTDASSPPERPDTRNTVAPAVAIARVASPNPTPHFPDWHLFGAQMSRLRPAALWAAALLALPVSVAVSQQPATPAAPAPEVGPKIGEMAPDFEFTGITRYGKLANTQKLSDFRGQTVVLAFFPKARTRG